MSKYTILAFLMLAGCSKEPTMGGADDAPRMTADGERFTVNRVDVFRDTLAYDGLRGVYIIRDKRTGREYIGVSGIGITEAAGHYVSNGKTGYVVEDER